MKHSQEAAAAALIVEKDEEIVVDDEPKPEEVKDKEPVVDAVVVLDDNEDSQSKEPAAASDAEKACPEKPSEEPVAQATNGNVPQEVLVDVDPEIIVEEESQPAQEPMRIDEIKPLTTLEELQTWLHDKAPISDEQLRTLCITMDDFGRALKKVQPSAKREGFATVPDTTWDNVGSLRDIREELQMAILVG